jgi:hypothetical protein
LFFVLLSRTHVILSKQRQLSPVHTAIWHYLNNQEAICTQYPNAYIILHDTRILGPFKSFQQAYRVAFAQYEIGSCVVKYCGKLEDVEQDSIIL